MLPVTKIISENTKMNDCGEMVEWYWSGKQKMLRENPVPLPIYPPWIHTWTGLGSNTHIRGGRSVIIRRPFSNLQ